jgi:hypothetical protein
MHASILTQDRARSPQMIRAWDPSSLDAVLGREPMGHEGSVRALAAGCCSSLMSGDANGELAIWSL